MLQFLHVSVVRENRLLQLRQDLEVYMLSFGLRGSFGRVNNQVAERGVVSSSPDPTVTSPVDAYVRRSEFVAHTQLTLRSGAVDLMHGQGEEIVAAAADS